MIDVLGNFDFVLLAQVAFLFAALVQFWLFYKFYGKLLVYKDSSDPHTQVPVSVIISARNEADNLEKHLPYILHQDYPEYEVVVVNDGSYDRSQEILEEFQTQYPKLKIVNLPENDRFDGGKKLALTLGVKAAKYDRFLFTDADCVPASDKWIMGMSRYFSSDENIVLGYSPYQRSGGLLNMLICFDSLYVAANYLGLALAGVPYMGVGRNLSYTRDTFFSVGGFRSHYALRSGDDDLFVNQVATTGNTKVCVDENTRVDSIPKKRMKDYFKQKKRHITTARKYKPIHRLLLVIQPLSLVLFWLSVGLLLVFHTWLYIVLGVVALRVIVQIFIFSQLSKKMGFRRLIFLTPVLEVMLFCFTGAAHLSNAMTKQTKWTN
jgi:glycosyltransferase involved in cell wall biosynthesis